jgi:hypothetical protein
MPNSLVPITVLVLLAGVTACAGSPPRQESQVAPAANLAAYRTFGWKPVGDAASQEPLRIVDANIRTAIRAELTRRGYVEAESNAEILLTYDSEAQAKLKSSPFRIGIGLGSFGSNVGGSVNVGTPSVQSINEGRLSIHVIDAAENREVWVGTVEKRIDKQPLDADGVAALVALALQDFPVQAGSKPAALQ